MLQLIDRVGTVEWANKFEATANDYEVREHKNATQVEIDADWIVDEHENNK